MILLAAAEHQQSQALGTFIFSVASGLLVLVLGYVARSIRSIIKQHYWLVEQVNDHGRALETQGRAIETLLQEQKATRRREQRARRDG